MLNRIKVFIQSKQIERLKKQFKTPDDEMLDFEYNPKKDMRKYTVPFQREGKLVKEEFEESFRQELGGKFYKIAKEDFDELKSNLQDIANDRVLNREEEKVKNNLLEITLLLQENEGVSKHPYLMGIFKNMVQEIQLITSINIDLFNEKKQETRGNKNWIDGKTISDQMFENIVIEANKLINKNPNQYLPQRGGSFLSNTLKAELSEIFDIPESTIDYNLRNRAVKKDQLFIAKINC